MIETPALYRYLPIDSIAFFLSEAFLLSPVSIVDSEEETIGSEPIRIADFPIMDFELFPEMDFLFVFADDLFCPMAHQEIFGDQVFAKIEVFGVVEVAIDVAKRPIGLLFCHFGEFGSPNPGRERKVAFIFFPRKDDIRFFGGDDFPGDPVNQNPCRNPADDGLAIGKNLIMTGINISPSFAWMGPEEYFIRERRNGIDEKTLAGNDPEKIPSPRRSNRIA